MGTQRISNKDLLDAINSIGPAVAQAIQGTQVAATPAVETTAAPEQDASEGGVKVPPAYHKRVLAKVQAKTNTDGEARVLYARRNLAGEVKLAYCLASRWGTLKDNGLLGAVDHVKPE